MITHVLIDQDENLFETNKDWINILALTAILCPFAIRHELSDLREMESASWTDTALQWKWGYFLSPLL